MTENLPAQRTEPPKVKVDLSQPLTDLDEAFRLSNALSTSELVSDSLRGKPASILHVILTGQAMDLHWTEALRLIYSPGHGQIGMRAVLLLSQLRKKGHRYSAEYSEDGESCTFTLVRKDEPDSPYSATFSRQDAIDAKLVSKDNWTKYFKRMLRARAITDCVGFAAPEILLGFTVEGDEPETPPVQLQPQSPAPPEPAGEAAPGGQAAQAEQLARLDKQMREEMTYPQEQSVSDPVGTLPQDLVSPQVGGNFEVEPIGVTLAREADEAEAVAEAQDFAGVAGSAAAATTSSAPTAETATGPDLVERFADPSLTGTEAGPDDAAGKAKTVVLSEWFTTLGYDPKRYRPQVLHACSVFVQRPIAGVRDLKAAEVMKLSNALSEIFRRTDELAPVSRLADEMGKWEHAWRTADPQGLDAYEESRKT